MPGSFRPVRQFRALVRADPTGVRAGFVALLVSSGGDLLAGLTLGSITGTLQELPGLLVLVPAAIGMRGNVFGALGSRLGTAIHSGTFTLARRREHARRSEHRGIARAVAHDVVGARRAREGRLRRLRSARHDLGRRLRGDLGDRRRALVGRRAGDHRRCRRRSARGAAGTSTTCPRRSSPRPATS